MLLRDRTVLGRKKIQPMFAEDVLVIMVLDEESGVYSQARE